MVLEKSLCYLSLTALCYIIDNLAQHSAGTCICNDTLIKGSNF